MSATPAIGFIGLGIMGVPMASRLINEGFHVHLFNRTARKGKALIEQGARWSTSPAEMAGHCDVIITMVSDDEALAEITEGVGGVLEAITSGKTLINMSTVSMNATRRLAQLCAEREVAFIDAPVSGSKPQAESGQLIILAGGDHNAVETMSPILLTMGSKIIYTGETGNGTALKLSINLIVAHLTFALSEGIALTKRLNIVPELLLEVIENAPSVKNNYMLAKGKKILEDDLSPQFPLKHLLKDVRLILREDPSLTGARAIEAKLTEAENAGLGDSDCIAAAKVIE